jgi:molybdenum cofactor cytidylyltransferase
MEPTAYGIIILAAGNSSRLGEPKQLLTYQGKSLIRRIAEAGIEAIGDPVIIVTGSNAALIENELLPLPCHHAFNADWQEGMSSSIRTGITKLLEIAPNVTGVILAVSDQPFVASSLFKDLIEKAKTENAGIVACAYGDTLGTPVLFTRKYFDELLSLTGAEGAKKLLKMHRNDVVSHSFPLGTVDIDTREDYQNLI